MHPAVNRGYCFFNGLVCIWQIDHDHEFDVGNPDFLPLHWERVIDGLGPLGIAACYHNFPENAYAPTLGNGSMNVGQYECEPFVTPNGFVDRPCVVESDYRDQNVPDHGPGTTLLNDVEGVFHNDVHGFIGGSFFPASTVAGTMVFWTFHTQVSTNLYANWKHAQRRDMGVPERVCNAQSYEAETMFHSTGGSTPGGWNIWSNGYISTTHIFTPGPSQIRVVAQGQPAFDVAPHMIVSVGGEPIGDVFVNSTSWTSYVFPFNAPAGSQEIRVEFDNDIFVPPSADRNLLVDNLHIDCVDPSSGPCASFCANPEIITWSGSYQSGALGMGASCRETTQAVAGGNCGNFTGGRQLFLNGTSMPCGAGNWPSLPAPVNGGYCMQITPGDDPWALATLW